MIFSQREFLIKTIEWEKKRKLRVSERKAINAFIQRKPLIAKFLPEIRRIYADSIKDYLSLYRIDKPFDYDIIRNHFQPRFQSMLLYIYNTTSYKFGRILRTELGFEKYGYKDFNSDISDINARYDATIFSTFSSMADKQSKEITDTLINDLQFYTDKAIGNYNDRVQSTSESLSKITSELVSATAFGGITIFNVKIRDLMRKQQTLSNELKNLKEKKEIVIKQDIKRSLQKRFKSRSDLVSEQSVGSAQSVAQQVEANSITSQEGSFLTPITSRATAYSKLLTKEWIAILDRRTRPWHSQADGQIVSVKDYFLVGGERLMIPRDPNGSAGNTMRCRCESVYITNLRG